MPTPSPTPRFSSYTSLPFEALIATFTVLPILVLIYFYPSLPERIPEYLNLRGEVAASGAKGFASVFRLPLMAIDLQLIGLFMKYGSWLGSMAHPLEPAGDHAVRLREKLELQVRLWDWFRGLIAVKFGASSLDVIFLSFARFHFLATPVRIISSTAGLLGIFGAALYGYRLYLLNRKLKGADESAQSRRQSDPAHLRVIFYYNPADPSFFHDKYLFNFANKWAFIFIGCLIALPLLMFLPMLNL